MRNRASFRLSLERRQAASRNVRRPPFNAAASASGCPIFLAFWALHTPFSTHPYPSGDSWESIKIDIRIVVFFDSSVHQALVLPGPSTCAAFAHQKLSLSLALIGAFGNQVLLHRTAIPLRLSVVVLSAGVDYWAAWKKPTQTDVHSEVSWS